MQAVIIDADNCIAGRLASRVAKELLKGNEIHIINAEKAVISGNKKYVQELFLQKVSRGDPYHGPFYPIRADRLLRRIVRGMLPHRKQRGRDALKRLHIHMAVPEELKGGQITKIRNTENRLDKYITIGKLSEQLGARAYGG